MAERKPSSPKKPTKKAGTRTRSTTSSTTARTAAADDKETTNPTALLEPLSPTATRLLAIDGSGNNFHLSQQTAYLYLLARGASPAAACGQLGLSLVDVADCIEQNDSFRSRLARVNQLLSQNVAAALYRSAMEGSVSAQTFYLKNRPPPEWPELAADPHSKPMNDLTDDELIAQFRQEAPALLARLAEEDPSAKSPATPGSIPQPAPPAR